ncbi:MAG: hypothetical protein ACYDEY_13545 [Acidimicrobiales bacterium]
MATGISALQRNASAVVRKVAAAGIAEEITDRGRVVAVIIPPPESTGLERLRASGATRRASGESFAVLLSRAAILPRLDLAGALTEQRNTER